MLATSPVPVVTNQVAASAGIGGGAGSNTNLSNPSIAVDPIDPTKLVSVFTDRDTSSGTTQYSVRVTYSNDGGQTWQSLAGGIQPRQSGDPTSTTGALLQDTAEGVAFDRNNNFYVGVLETNNFAVATSAGAVEVDKYSFTSLAPTSVNIQNYGSALYTWNESATNQNRDPQILNFSLAVDAGAPTYTDPANGAVQSDPNAGSVYLAWTSYTPPPSPAPSPYSGYEIEAVGSRDGVNWFGLGTNAVAGGPAGTPISGKNQGSTAPQIAVSQGKAGGTDGGLISIVWDDIFSGRNANPPVDYIRYAQVVANGNALTVSLATSIGTTTVLGAQTGANFALNTPSSPIGIGPGAVIAVDNTLGAYSPHQGRIYVSYVNRSTAAGNPSDNTDIYLSYSDNDGMSWSNPTIVNDDNSLVDGHTSALTGLKGRAQFEPAIAVDNATGTLVMSWLDVRDDASLQRYADYVTYSLDGGTTFSPQTFADKPDIVTDATTGSTFVAGPYAGNDSAGNPNAETSTAFGVHQGLAVLNGVVHPAWSTSGPDILGNQLLTIQTARVSIPAGPRIISGTSGSTGTTSFSNFDVTFDRPIQTSSFTSPSQVAVEYLNAQTKALSSVAVSGITPLDPFAAQSTIGVSASNFDFVTSVTVSGINLNYGGGGAPLTLQLIAPNGASTTLASGVGSLSGGTYTTTAFYGSNAVAGNWTLRIVDANTGTAVGRLNGWSLAVNSYYNTVSTYTPPALPITFADDASQATRFRVDLAQTQYGVGTYSYAIFGASIQDLVRSMGATTYATDTSASLVYGTPSNLPSGFNDSPPNNTATSTVAVSGAPLQDRIDQGGAVHVNNVDITYNGSNTLTLQLTSPSGQVVTLGTINGPVTGPVSYTTGAYAGQTPINGNWTLSVRDAGVSTVNTGVINGWSLQLGVAAPQGGTTTVTGNIMDQNPSADQFNPATGTRTRNGNYFANPSPKNPGANSPFSGPYDATTLPIVIAGPRVVGSFVAGGVNDPAGSAQPGNNLVLNATVGSIDVTFNQPMDPSTFTPAQVLSLIGPAGPIAGPFTVVADPQAGEDPNYPQTFKIGFATQQLSGTYSLTLGAGVKSKTGAAVDTNQNAAVSLLFTNSTGTLPSTPSTFTSTQSSPIPAGSVAVPSSVSTTITVPAADTSLIKDFSLALNISYPNDPDLTATLTTPIIDPNTGKPYTVLLFGGNGSASGSQANFTNTVFQDSAATPIGNGAPPFLGQFKPLQSLLVDGHLAGQSMAGTYTLTITNSGSSSGTLNGWSITATPVVATNTGLGEPVADQSTASFRIFTMDPTNPLSSNTWTAMGPASVNSGGNSGRVGAIAVDASDPSGNTVYAAGASGGVWKTTDFLTTSANGPTWTLLTGAARGNALSIGSIAVYSRNGDPGQSIIVAGTGEGNTAGPGVQGSSTVGTSAGVGFLISYDGGKSWTLDDSLVNYGAGGVELPEAQRKHEFVGTTTYKVIIDPNKTPSGNVVIYAALGGGQNGLGGQGGLYRSIDSGHTWTLMKSGYATDVVFDPNSGAKNAVNTTGNLLTLYAAFQGQGVFLTPDQGVTWNAMNGGVGDPLVQNLYQGKSTPVTVNGPPLTPSSGGGRIVLAKPALTGNALLDAEYETWLYAAVVNADGSFNGLFLTKDNGYNWTDVRIPNAVAATGTTAQGLAPTNDIGQTNYNITGGQGNYDFALAVDPNNPNVVYIGGSADFGPSTMIRVDATRLSDPYSLYSSSETLGGQVPVNATSPVTIKDPKNLSLFGYDPLTSPYTNIYRNPVNVFSNNSLVQVHDTGTFANDGSGAWYTPFDGFINGTDVHVILPMVDPTTGKTRLLVGYDQGIATVVDNNGSELTSIGGQQLATGVRNGNIQITQFYNGAAQPTALAAQVAGALFYGMAQDDGFPTSDPNVLNTGNIAWSGSTGDGTDVITDATGTGTVFQTEWPCCNPVGPNEFFQVNGTGRTFGLLQSTSVPPGPSLPGTPDPQWPYGPSFNFAVNPVNNQQIIIGSGAGRLFVTQNQGVIWTPLADPSVFDGTILPALAYGAPQPGAVGGALGDYMLVGTAGGHIYATFTGGGGGGGNAWINISTGLNNAPVERIVTDPTRGTFDAYAITTSGVFYNPDTSAAGSSWVNITGDLFKQTVTPFGDANLTTQAVIQLGALAVDWRYVIPNDPTDPTKGNHPMLYVGGIGGVYRSTNNGTNWTTFPDQTLATPVANGNLPTTSVTDLDMVLGNVDPTTGHPDVANGPNLLLATTYGTGSYGIRLAPIIFNDSTNKVTETQNTTTGVLNFSGLSEQSAFGSSVAVTVMDVSDPANPIFLGGYNPSDGSPATSPTFGLAANQTDVNGKFGVSASYPTPPAGSPFLYDGARTIAVYATDASGTKGNVVTFQITNNLPAPTTAPALVNADNSGPPLTNAVISGTAIVTPAAKPNFAFSVPNPGAGNAAAVSLVRLDAQGNPTTAATVNLTGTASGTPLTGFIKDTGATANKTYTYEYQYTVTINGKPATSPLSPGTTVTVIPAVTAPTLNPVYDSGSKGDGITNNTRPQFLGTAAANPANDKGVTLELVETAYGATASGLATLPTPVVLATAADPVNGQYALQPGSALAAGTYTLLVETVDTSGDVVASAPLTLTISTQGPKTVPTIALLPASDLPGNNPYSTVVRQPIVYGTTDPGATVTVYGISNGGSPVKLASATAQPYPNNGKPAGYYQVQLPSNLNDGTVTLGALASDAAGNTNPTPGVLVLHITSLAGDYTGVGKAGLAVYSSTTGTYAFSHPGVPVTTFVNNFGLPGVDIPVAGDYNGDGQTDPAIYRTSNGWWAVDVNSQANGQYVMYIPPIAAPSPSIIPTPLSFDVGGMTNPAVYNVATGTWTILHNVAVPGQSTAQTIPFGAPGNATLTPVPADYAAAGTDQLAFYVSTSGYWFLASPHLDKSTILPPITNFQAGDVPVPANYDGLVQNGVGRVEEAIFRPSIETFFVYNPNLNATRAVTMPRLAGQGAADVIIPVPADYTGDGKVDAAIFDQTLGTFEYIDSATGSVFTRPFFLTRTDIPTAAPESYRVPVPVTAAVRSAAVAAPAATAAAVPATASATSTATSQPRATPAVVVGAAIPNGLSSTGRSSDRPPVPTASPAPSIRWISYGSRPAQGNATDEALASLSG